ncbi:PKD-like domain-containing protein [Bacteroides heparinolyticus]|uniref:PKD-like domain-containing protein n=1 Tax=Prevotella heparinolytica TaxID=28113 RepID=UPI003F9EF785
MKKLMNLGCAMCIIAFAFTACSKDDPEPLSIGLAAQYETPNCKVLDIKPTIANGTAAKYKWSCGDSIYSTDEVFTFITAEVGKKDFVLTVTDAEEKVYTANFAINVTDGGYKNIQTSVIEYDPAPYEFINTYVIKNRDKATVMKELNDMLKAGKKFKDIDIDNGYRLGLPIGSMGGSAVLGFDHTIVNVSGEDDFKMEASPDVCMSGVVYVAYDKNKNGKPDEDEWYELKGDSYGNEKVETLNAFVTYSSVDYNQDWNGFEIHYKDDLDEQHLMAGEACFPGYDDQGNFMKESGWREPPFTINYKRVMVNEDRKGYICTFKNAFNIENAVDQKGNSVNLPGIDFIKIVVGGILCNEGTLPGIAVRDIYDCHLTK